MATAKHKFQNSVFNAANETLVDFLDELQKLAKDAFGFAAHAIIEQFIFAKKPAHLKTIKKSENGTYEHIVTHLEKELELNGSEAPDELQINNVSHNAETQMRTDPNQRATTVKKTEHYRNQCRLLKRQKEQSENSEKYPRNKNSGANNSIPNNNANKNNKKIN